MRPGRQTSEVRYWSRCLRPTYFPRSMRVNMRRSMPSSWGTRRSTSKDKTRLGKFTHRGHKIEGKAPTGESIRKKAEPPEEGNSTELFVDLGTSNHAGWNPVVHKTQPPGKPS